MDFACLSGILFYSAFVLIRRGAFQADIPCSHSITGKTGNLNAFYRHSGNHTLKTLPLP
jgi:hypothetical protein